MFKRILDNTNKHSLANKFRLKRFKHFNQLIRSLPAPVTILDLGGTENFWQQMALAGNKDFIITILNLNEPGISQKDNMKFIRGNAIDLGSFSDKSFNVVFSNSVIEHIPGKENRKKMSDEICRVGVNHFVQTPNYYFPFEPHFLFPLFQFFPQFIQLFLLTNFSMGWFNKCHNKDEALQLLEENRLLKLNEFRSYFPKSRIIKEKFMFLNKSYIAVNK